MKIFYSIPEKFLRTCAYAITTVILATPLFTFANFYFPFITPRNFIFRIAVEILLVVYALLVIQNRRYAPTKNLAIIFLAAFVGALTLASIQGVNPMFSFWSGFERMDGLITFYHLLVFLVVLVSIFRTEEQWHPLLGNSLVIAFLIAMVGLSQFRQVNILLASSGGERISATLGNATYLAAYLLLNVFFALYFLQKPAGSYSVRIFRNGIIALDVLLVVLQGYALIRDNYGILNQVFSDGWLATVFVVAHVLVYGSYFYRSATKAHYVIRAFIAFLIVFFLFMMSITQTRGAILGLGAGLVVAYVLILLQKTPRMLKMGSSGVVIALALCVGLIFANKDTTFVQTVPIFNKIASISISDSTTITRLATWKAAFRSATESPRRLMFGWGVDNFNVAFNKYFPTVIYTDEGTPLWFDRPHNLLIQYLVEGGILGVGLYCAFLVMLLVQMLSRRDVRYTGIIFTAGIVAYVVQNLFVFDSINSYIPFYVLIGCVVTIINRGKQGEQEVSGALSTSAGMLTISAAVVVSVASIVLLNMPALQSNRTFVLDYKKLNAELERKSYDRSTAVTLMDDIGHGPFLGRNELLGATSEYLVTLIQSSQLPASEATDFVTQLVAKFDAARTVTTNDARLNLFEMNLLLNAGSFDKTFFDRAAAIGLETLPLSPDRPHLYYIIGRAYMAKGEFGKGIPYFKEAVALAPNVFDSHWNLFAAYATVGDDSGARSEYQELRRIQTFDNRTYSRVVSVLAAGYQYDFALEVLNQAIAEHPDSTLLYIGLAQIYAQAGRNSEARTATLKAVELDPTLKSEADDFLTKLDAGTFKRLPPVSQP
ncbi:MAG: hypothetical protein A3B30_04315 [Candidatus Komeilibacteria bacterium RIFCSPLOWO2_01_FULL_52_15]|uniref:O-antigen ligase-related domain-containing protein n=2 Tax=Candidatus Komeiliibacteriota TaxID=1817908 RepID=A0A1G2BS94_9BACT|nr:MAG: hypothetical protein A2677_04075 [Candidatus Komeilibacteria bacterium RIFCSPHIGHO2_01_FULL_52_14]OGY91107.1 MAG: hypothetical protein A3B30_04315 [Candidatus Komeilibacteria bacterium RIFCSPLOWO2_01_FULL_52_15]